LTECDATQILLDYAKFTNPLFLAGVVGSALWTVAYVVFAREGMRERIYALPLLAICLNFTWEAIAVFLIDNPIAVWRWLEWSWLAVDLILLEQLFRYGRAAAPVAELRERFNWVVVGTLVLAFVGQYTFIEYFNDVLGFITAFVINLIMSVAFVFMYFLRPDQRGLSYAGAWLKMLGTLGTSIGCYALIPAMRCETGPAHFMTFLYVSIFAFDLLYVALLTKARWQRAAQAA
jgi:hypothetical protein